MWPCLNDANCYGCLEKGGTTEMVHGRRYCKWLGGGGRVHEKFMSLCPHAVSVNGSPGTSPEEALASCTTYCDAVGARPACVDAADKPANAQAFDRFRFGCVRTDTKRDDSKRLPAATAACGGLMCQPNFAELDANAVLGGACATVSPSPASASPTECAAAAGLTHTSNGRMYSNVTWVDGKFRICPNSQANTAGGGGTTATTATQAVNGFTSSAGECSANKLRTDSSVSLATCADECRNDVLCKGFTYNTSAGKCSLRGSECIGREGAGTTITSYTATPDGDDLKLYSVTQGTCNAHKLLADSTATLQECAQSCTKNSLCVGFVHDEGQGKCSLRGAACKGTGVGTDLKSYTRTSNACIDYKSASACAGRVGCLWNEATQECTPMAGLVIALIIICCLAGAGMIVYAFRIRANRRLTTGTNAT